MNVNHLIKLIFNFLRWPIENKVPQINDQVSIRLSRCIEWDLQVNEPQVFLTNKFQNGFDDVIGEFVWLNLTI